MMNYDAWLEKPYQDKAREDDAFQNFCEHYGYDPDSEEAEYEFEDHMQSAAEDAAIAAYEARMERDYDDPGWDL